MTIEELADKLDALNSRLTQLEEDFKFAPRAVAIVRAENQLHKAVCDELLQQSTILATQVNEFIGRWAKA